MYILRVVGIETQLEEAMDGKEAGYHERDYRNDLSMASGRKY